MSSVRSAVLGYVLPILAIVVLTVLLTVTLFRLTDIQRAMRSNVNANMVWVIYQTHIESLMLADAVQDRLVNPASTNDIVHRYQMFLSRIGVLNDGPQQRALLVTGMTDVIAGQAEAVRQLGSRIGSAEMASTNYMHMRNALDTFNALLLKASNRAMVAQWEEAGARIDTYRNAVLTIFFMMIGIWAGSAIISIQLLLALKKARANERSKQREVDLRQQLESERKISELYRSFGSMLSHQFRTPLAIIDASMQRLIRAGSRMDADEVGRRASKAREATHRLTYLIENILRADRFLEQLEVSMGLCSLVHLAQQAVTEQKLLAPTREIQFLDETHTSAIVACDAILTLQIIGNLLSNAVKYSEDHTVVFVRVYREAGRVCCAVRDDGRGISDTDMPHIFKRYFRACAATDVVGTGIGLHIANELASLQQGKIHVYSEPGVGSTFVLCFPASRAGGSIVGRTQKKQRPDKGGVA